MIRKEPGPDGKVRVTFSLPSSFWADTIHIVGDFNDWNASATPLSLGDTCWSITLDLDPDSSYQFRYLVNNSDWVNEWQADQFTASEWGGDNSIIFTFLPEDQRSQTQISKHTPRQRPSLRVIQGGKQEKQAV